MTYDEKSQKSHTSSIPSEHKVLILTEMRRNRKSFHGSLTPQIVNKNGNSLRNAVYYYVVRLSNSLPFIGC